MIKKYFIDRESYSIEDGRIYGEMGYTFCDMDETPYDELRDAVMDATLTISEETEEGIEEGEIPVMVVYECLFNDDAEYFYASDAVSGRPLVALVGKCEYSKLVSAAWRRERKCPIKVIDLA